MTVSHSNRGPPLLDLRRPRSSFSPTIPTCIHRSSMLLEISTWLRTRSTCAQESQRNAEAPTCVARVKKEIHRPSCCSWASYRDERYFALYFVYHYLWAPHSLKIHWRLRRGSRMRRHAKPLMRPMKTWVSPNMSTINTPECKHNSNTMHQKPNTKSRAT